MSLQDGNEPQLSGRCWWHEGEDSRDRRTLTVVTVARARGRSSARARGRKGKGTVALQPEAQTRGSHNSLSGLNLRFKSGCDLILSPLQVASMKTDLIAKNYLSRMTVGKVYKYSGFDWNLTKDRKWVDFSLLPVKKWESMLEKLDDVHCFSGLCILVKSNCPALGRERHKYWPSKWAAISLLRMPGV